jgi:hypothetical protein
LLYNAVVLLAAVALVQGESATLLQIRGEFERTKLHDFDVGLCQAHPGSSLSYRKIEQEPADQDLLITLRQDLDDELYLLRCPTIHCAGYLGHLFGKRSSWEENSFLPLTAVLADEQKACIVGKETNPDKQAESPRAEDMERSLHSIKHVISYCPSKKPPPKNHGYPRLSREREMHPALQFPFLRVFLTG